MVKTIFQIDVWAGKLHSQYEKRLETDDWEALNIFIKEQVLEGKLCNILIKPIKYVNEAIH